MSGDDSLKKIIFRRQKYFVARELQLSIALLVIIALLGGIFLQSISRAVSLYIGINTPLIGMMLIVGYVIIVGFLSVVFSNRLVGPFKRLEYEMKGIKRGEYDKRLTVRYKDDLHVRNFIDHTNDLIAATEDLRKGQIKHNADISAGLVRVGESLDNRDIEAAKKEIRSLQEKIISLKGR